ncbi:glycoside hydrolase family 5 protein [Tessaracoccus massiliensis]|uniref:glycoside hydrolase family 5 protein n=1 Tax=Tessaracoccus massiliensis TaxID=1522311 RepID=UPI00058EBE67|nr:cellulase family glycosylhydrolase [Tessaracoccus massiliensis]
MQWTIDGTAFRDEHGRHTFLHGINFVDKNPERRAPGIPPWTDEDLAQASAWGLNGIRLGVIWAAAMPEPGRPDEGYLGWLREQVETCRRHGLHVVLDAHQDLYAQAHSDGAPGWATLTDHPFDATSLWSDAYLSSPAVHEALDAFWSNAQVGGRGLQDHFAEFWLAVLDAVGKEPAVVALDLFNEPVPGSALPGYFELLIGAFAELTGQDPMAVADDWADPEAKFAQLQRLDDPQLHRALGDAVAPALAEFDGGSVDAFYRRVGGAIREAGHSHIILRENTYLSNMGVPSLAPLPADLDPVASSPHAYDLVVDTPAVTMASDQRIRTILERHAELQQRWQRPALLGEWGALSTYDGVAGHAHAIQDFVDEHLWSQTYWCWEPAFAGTDAQRSLVRPRVHAVVGTVEAIDPAGWSAEFTTSPADVARADAHQFFVPEGAAVTYTVDGAHRALPASDGGVLRLPAEPGSGRVVVRG